METNTDLMSVSIDELEMYVREYNALSKAGIKTVGDLIEALGSGCRIRGIGDLYREHLFGVISDLRITERTTVSPED